VFGCFVLIVYWLQIVNILGSMYITIIIIIRHLLLYIGEYSIITAKHLIKYSILFWEKEKSNLNEIALYKEEIL